MRAIWSVIFAAAFLGCAGPAAAESIVFRNIAARVVIIPEQRADVRVIFLKTDRRQPMRIETLLGGRTVVEGTHWFAWLWSPHADCEAAEGRPATFVPDEGRVAYDDLPQIAVRVPMDAEVEAGGVLYGSVGRSRSLRLHVAGCGDWTIANVQDELRAEYAGSGRLHTGSAGRMTLKIAGSSTATTTAVANGLNIDIAGVGEIHVGRASGPIGVHMAGGGDVRIDGGRATAVDVHIAGSGDVDFGGVADSLDAHIAGSGFVRAAKVTGAVDKFIAGSGSVEVGP